MANVVITGSLVRHRSQNIDLVCVTDFRRHLSMISGFWEHSHCAVCRSASIFFFSFLPSLFAFGIRTNAMHRVDNNKNYVLYNFVMAFMKCNFSNHITLDSLDKGTWLVCVASYHCIPIDAYNVEHFICTLAMLEQLICVCECDVGVFFFSSVSYHFCWLKSIIHK